jgi:hypothetical protein
MDSIAKWEDFLLNLNLGSDVRKVLLESSSLFVPSDSDPDSGCGLLKGYRTLASRDRTLEIVESLANKLETTIPTLRSTVLRCKTIDLFHDPQPSPGFEEQLKSLLGEYRVRYFEPEVWSATDSMRSDKYSSAWCRLPRNLQPVMHKVVNDLKLHYTQPGVASLIDTIAEIHRSESGLASEKANGSNAWGPGHTWVLVAVKSDKSGAPPGLLMRLRIERLENGCGAIYPHPIKAAHLNFSASWSAAIRNAWVVVKNSEAKATTYDYRWWLTVVEPPEQGKQCTVNGDLDSPLAKWLAAGELENESATLAFALALKSVITDETLRQDRASSACFRDTSTVDQAYGWESLSKTSNPTLAPVGSSLLPNKDQIIRLCKRSNVEIEKLVVANGQVLELPSVVALKPIATFNEAYTEFSEMERILEDYAKWVAGRWDRIVEAGRPKKGEQSS